MSKVVLQARGISLGYAREQGWQTLLEGFDLVWQRLQTEQPSGVEGSRIVLDLLARRGRL